jgi:hypothetical protein
VTCQAGSGWLGLFCPPMSGGWPRRSPLFCQPCWGNLGSGNLPRLSNLLLPNNPGSESKLSVTQGGTSSSSTRKVRYLYLSGSSIVRIIIQVDADLLDAKNSLHAEFFQHLYRRFLLNSLYFEKNFGLICINVVDNCYPFLFTNILQP